MPLMLRRNVENALHIIRDGQEYEVQLENFVKRSEPEKQPDGKVWVENPSLHLTSLYYMQELRRQPGRENDPELREMQEEIAANFGKGRYIAAVQKEGNGVPLVKLKNGDQYQPVFTDILEFQRFNRENSMRPVVVEAKNLPKLLPPQVKGILLNPTSRGEGALAKLQGYPEILSGESLPAPRGTGWISGRQRDKIVIKIDTILIDFKGTG